MKHVDFKAGGVETGWLLLKLLKQPEQETGKTFVFIIHGEVSDERCASSVPLQLFLLNMNTFPKEPARRRGATAQDSGGKLREQVKDESDVERNSLLLSAFLWLLKWITSLLKAVPLILKRVLVALEKFLLILKEVLRQFGGFREFDSFGLRVQDWSDYYWWRTVLSVVADGFVCWT